MPKLQTKNHLWTEKPIAVFHQTVTRNDLAHEMSYMQGIHTGMDPRNRIWRKNFSATISL